MVGDLLRSLVNGKLRCWEVVIVEFVYLNLVNRSIERLFGRLEE